MTRTTWFADNAVGNTTKGTNPMTVGMLSQITKGTQPGPRKILLHGTAGIGKSTFGSMAPDPIFIQTEDGLRDIEAAKFPVAEKFADVMQAAWELSSEPHAFKTVVVDSLDWLERLAFAAVASEAGVENIDDIGFGKGYTAAIGKWMQLLSLLSALHDRRGMHVVLIAHSEIVSFASPDTESYDRYVPRLHKRSWPIVCEWASEVLFATYKVHTKKEKGGFGKDTYKGIGSGERVIRTAERPAHVAKNRIKGLPEELPLNWNEFYRYVAEANS